MTAGHSSLKPHFRPDLTLNRTANGGKRLLFGSCVGSRSSGMQPVRNELQASPRGYHALMHSSRNHASSSGSTAAHTPGRDPNGEPAGVPSSPALGTTSLNDRMGDAATVKGAAGTPTRRLRGRRSTSPPADPRVGRGKADRRPIDQFARPAPPRSMFASKHLCRRRETGRRPVQNSAPVGLQISGRASSSFRLPVSFPFSRWYKATAA